jgi:carbonic anhydrase
MGKFLENAGERTFFLELPLIVDPLRLRRKHKAELERLPDDDARAVRVAELNVQQSLDVLKQHPAVKKAANERGLTLHGMIYDIGAGQLRLLEDIGSGKKNNGLWSPN